jgi:hypothetical protein
VLNEAEAAAPGVDGRRIMGFSTVGISFGSARKCPTT